MLDKARTEESRVEWKWLDIAEWRPDPEHGLIYSNAVLHWLPPAHRHLHRELAARLETAHEARKELTVIRRGGPFLRPCGS